MPTITGRWTRSEPSFVELERTPSPEFIVVRNALKRELDPSSPHMDLSAVERRVWEQYKGGEDHR